MELELMLMNVLIMLGLTFFGHFEVKTPKWRRVLKWVIYMGLAVWLIPQVGRPWSFMLILFPGLVGITVHFWWCRRHGIHPFTAEPRERYYALRGWQ